MKTTLEERLKLAMAGPPKIAGKQLAAATGARGSSVSGWCTGKSKTMKASYLVAAAKLLGVRTEWLADGVGPMTDDQSVTTRAIAFEPPDPVRNNPAKHSDMALVLADVFDALPPAITIRAKALGRVGPHLCNAHAGALTKMGCVRISFAMNTVTKNFGVCVCVCKCRATSIPIFYFLLI